MEFVRPVNYKCIASGKSYWWNLSNCFFNVRLRHFQNLFERLPWLMKIRVTSKYRISWLRFGSFISSRCRWVAQISRSTQQAAKCLATATHADPIYIYIKSIIISWCLHASGSIVLREHKTYFVSWSRWKMELLKGYKVHVFILRESYTKVFIILKFIIHGKST